MPSLKVRYQEILNQLKPGVKLLAVSKYQTLESIRGLYELGHRDFAENKVQELELKAKKLIDLGIRWHFIGKLQSNKVNKLLSIPNLVSIQSIDSLSLLKKILSKDTDSQIGLFLQVNTSGEKEKTGLENNDEIFRAIEMIKLSSKFYFQGLMTIGPIRTEDFEQGARTSFKKLSSLKQDILQSYPDQELELSMGMSADFPLAMEYGTDWVRVGSAIFGPRK